MTISLITVQVNQLGSSPYEQEYRFTCPIQMEQFLTLCESYGIPIVTTIIKDIEGVLC